MRKGGRGGQWMRKGGRGGQWMRKGSRGGGGGREGQWMRTGGRGGQWMRGARASEQLQHPSVIFANIFAVFFFVNNSGDIFLAT